MGLEKTRRHLRYQKNLDMNDKRLKNVPTPVENADAVNKIYADILSDETKRYVNSVTPFVNQQYEYAATNNINIRDFTLKNVGVPTNTKDVATKGYVDKSGGGAFEARNGGITRKALYISGVTRWEVLGTQRRMVKPLTRDT